MAVVRTILFILAASGITNGVPNRSGNGSGNDNRLYPISASWFRDRFTVEEWTQTLKDFAKIGGDTVFLRAPPLVLRSANDIKRDPAFVWCGSSNSSTGSGSPHCVDEAIEDMHSAGFIVDAFATYQYEEDFNFNILLCPIHEKVIHSSRVYYRLVLPSNASLSINPCNLHKGDHVTVLFTSFAGTDPHALLLQAAKPLNVTVFFGLPAAPRTPGGGLAVDSMDAYYGFVQRVLIAHQIKYDPSVRKSKVLPEALLRPSKHQPLGTGNPGHVTFTQRRSRVRTDWDVIGGYYGTDEACLATDFTSQGTKRLVFMELYKALGTLVRQKKKKFAVSPYILLNKSFGHHSLEAHVQGFEALAKLGVADIIAVQEGRGAGKGCYYWPTEEHMAIADLDPVLDKVIRYIDPSVPHNVTFKQQFTASNNMLFRGFSDKRDELLSKGASKFDLWLNVEAFEYLRDDPCLPVDPAGSGMAELLQRTTKTRLDWAIAMAGFFPQKIISFAWDSDFTCSDRSHNVSLREEIMSVGGSIIANCSFHSAANMSIVVIGYNMASNINMTYKTREGKVESTQLFGYYFEMDWGIEHGREGSMYYTQCWDTYNAYDVARKGSVRLQLTGQKTYCIFEYDYE